MLAGGLVLGGDDDGAPREERDNRMRDDLKPPAVGATTTRPTSTSPTTTLPAGPVFPEQTGAALVLVGFSNQWTWLDLDTGTRRDVRVDVSEPYAAVPVAGGIVGIGSGPNPEARYWPLPEGDPVSLGLADQVLSSGSPDSVWLLYSASDGPGAEGSDARRVDLGGAPLTEAVHLPVSYVAGATDLGLVFSRAGRTYLVDDAGVRPLARGDALQSTPNTVVVVACDDSAICKPELVDVGTGRARRLSEIPYRYEAGMSVLLSDDGDQLVTVTYEGSRQSLRFHDREGRVLGTVDDLAIRGQPRLLPSDLGLVAAVDGLGVVRIFLTEAGAVVEPIAALQGDFADTVHVIPR